MTVVTRKIAFSTSAGTDIIDLTPEVTDALAKSGLAAGTVTVFCPGATGAVTTVEFEPGLVNDLKAFFERIAPAGARYEHNERWKDGNGHSHVRASLVGPSLTVPFAESRLLLGRWQQSIFIDFDVRSRDREIVLQFMGG